MASIQTTRKLLMAYASTEPWKAEHDEAQACVEIEETLTWGVHLFRGLTDLEARAQAHGLQNPTPGTEQLLETMPLLYQLWVEVSERYLAVASALVQDGCQIQGLDEFRETLEEARCLVENLALEDELPQFEELIPLARPDNPRPERYGE